MTVSREKIESAAGIASAWKMVKAFDGFPREGIRHTRLPSSMEILFGDISPGIAMDNVVTVGRAPLAFCFHLSGTGRAHLSYPLFRNEVVDGTPGSVIISYSPGATCRTELSAGQRYRLLNIYVSPEKLHAVLGGDLDQVPRCFHALLRGDDPPPFTLVFSMSRQTRAIIDQMEKAPYKGSLSRLFMEAKSMELIVRQMFEGMEAPPPVRQRTPGPDDTERVYRARAILFREIDNPPALKTLAARVGTNTTKLKTDFRRVFGTTAYSLVRRERVERSRRMLREGRLNITQIGQALGFYDASHFIREFSKYYGITPGKFIDSL